MAKSSPPSSKLKRAGITEVEKDLRLMTRAELAALYRFPLPKGQATKTKQWLARTGGVEGKAFGLESESCPQERLHSLLAAGISGKAEGQAKAAEAWGVGRRRRVAGVELVACRPS